MALQSTVSLPQPTPSAPLVWVLESRTAPGTFYQVSQVTESGWRCSCPAGQWGRPCWHVRQCQEEVVQLRADLAAGIPIVDDGLPRVSTSRVCGICDVRHACEHCRGPSGASARTRWTRSTRMLHNTSKGGEHSARRTALTTKGQITVALIRLERALEHLTEDEQADLLAELQPLARVARSRVESRQRAGAPLVASRMA